MHTPKVAAVTTFERSLSDLAIDSLVDTSKLFSSMGATSRRWRITRVTSSIALSMLSLSMASMLSETLRRLP